MLYANMTTIKQHPSYEQVMLDVNRCAGRLEHIRQCYLHRTDDDDEPPEDLTDELERGSNGDLIDDGASNSLSENSDLEDLEGVESSVEDKNDHQQLDEASKKLQRIAKDLKYQRKLKRKLAKLILKLLIKKPDLHYYQGFHDVCLTYMTIYGAEQAYDRLDTVIDSHFQAFMQPTMYETQEFLALIPIIIGLQNPKAQEFLEQAEVGTIFALSWVITWFSHVLPNERDVEEIYSRLEETPNPYLILYLSAAIVLYKQKELLELEPEMSTVHKFLSQVPRKESLPIDTLLDDAAKAMKRWPPEHVKNLLEQQRQAKLQVYEHNILTSLAQRFAPNLTNLVTSSTRTAIIVFVVASALALQFDRWIR